MLLYFFAMLTNVTKCNIYIVTNRYNNVKTFFTRRHFKFMKGLKAVRKAQNLNQQKVAMDLNISREALSHYENGKREPSLDMLNKLSEYFNVSIDYLINGKEFTKK